MVTLQNVIGGLRRYLDSEMLSKITGVKKWIVGASLSMYLDNATNIFNSLKGNEFIKALDIIDKNDEIDIEKIYKYLSEQAQKGAVSFQLPMIGAVTLKETDLSKIYNLIMGEK